MRTLIGCGLLASLIVQPCGTVQATRSGQSWVAAPGVVPLTPAQVPALRRDATSRVIVVLRSATQAQTTQAWSAARDALRHELGLVARGRVTPLPLIDAFAATGSGTSGRRSSRAGSGPRSADPAALDVGPTDDPGDIRYCHVIFRKGLQVRYFSRPNVHPARHLCSITLLLFAVIGAPVAVRAGAPIVGRVTPGGGPALHARTCAAPYYVTACVIPSVLVVEARFKQGNTNIQHVDTGFVIRSDSTGTYVLTGRFVVGSATVRTLQTFAADGRGGYPVLAVARSASTRGVIGQLAVLRLPPSPLVPLIFGDSGRLEVLQSVIGIGYGGRALGLAGLPTVAPATISAVQRDQGDGLGPIWIQGQSESLVNSGIGGAPLLDGTDHVVGILLEADAQATFYALPSNDVATAADQLIASLAGGR